IALTSHVQAPPFGLAAGILQIDEGAALPEAAACILDKSLNLRFIPGMTHASRVHEEPARLAVLQEGPRGARIERIGAGHRRRKVIEHQALRAALEACPCLLEAFDGGLHRLVNQWP